MSKKKRILNIYEDLNGKEPFTEWLESIKDRKTRNRIYTRLDRLETGNPGDFRHVGEGVFELRIHFGPGYRIYYGEDGAVIIILLIGRSATAADRARQTVIVKSETLRKKTRFLYI